MSKTKQKTAEIFIRLLAVEEDKLTDDADLSTSLGADSLDTVELLMEVEKEFGISIPDEDAANLYTFGDVVKYVENKTHPQA